MLSFLFLSLLLGFGHFLRRHVSVLRTLFLPSCVIGGLTGLIILSICHYTGTRVPHSWTAGWAALPGILINVVFACLFLGIRIPRISEVWNKAGSQLAYGQIVAWGQYAVATAVVLVLIRPIWKVQDMFAGILPVGFEGGHGTAAGMGPVFNELGWAAGKDFALTSATFGIVSAIIMGIILINWAVRKGYTSLQPENGDSVTLSDISHPEHHELPSAGTLTVSSVDVDALSLHIVFVAIAVGIGYLFKIGLVSVENTVPFLNKAGIFRSFPLFPLCMMGGLIVQLTARKFGFAKIIDHGLTHRIQNSALDFLVTAAIATINLHIVLAGIVPLLILVAFGIIWNVFCVTFLARKVFRNDWFERSIAEMGQSMGVTATGLLLLRIVDPHYKTSAAEAFGYKQLLHEPIMGGGIWTGMAIPLLATIGIGKVFCISAAAIAIWSVMIITVLRKRV